VALVAEFSLRRALLGGGGLVVNSGAGAVTINGTPTVSSAAATFTVAITDAVGATASQTFSLAVNAAAAITTQPVSHSIAVGQTTSFIVAASGIYPPVIPFAVQRKSGATPSCSQANIVPVLPKPVATSSAMRKMPCSLVIRLISERKPVG